MHDDMSKEDIDENRLIEERLEKLRRMRDKGFISPDEYEKKKRSLLDSL